MATKIRLQRAGRKGLPFYRIAVFDSRTRRDGRFIEKLGFYDPLAKDDSRKIVVDRERLDHWVNSGAQTSEALVSLLAGADVAVPVPGAGKRARRARARKRRKQARSS
jgi:small subunit ribosomal protein S16